MEEVTAGGKEGNKSSSALRDVGKEVIRWNLCPQSSEQPRFEPQMPQVLKERGHIWDRNQESFILCMPGRWGMTDKVQCAYLFYDLVSRLNHKPEILFHLPSQD